MAEPCVGALPSSRACVRVRAGARGACAGRGAPGRQVKARAGSVRGGWGNGSLSDAAAQWGKGKAEGVPWE